jgi:hypothetical protein
MREVVTENSRENEPKKPRERVVADIEYDGRDAWFDSRPRKE